MNLPQDARAHLKWGAAAAIGALLLIVLSRAIGLCGALAIAGFATGWAVERYQAVRREGTASWADAAYTAAPFMALALALLVLNIH